MGLKKFNAKKEIKKLKRRSNKLKKVGVIGAIIGTIFIVSSYSLYSYTKSSVAFNSTINKRVKTTVTAVNGIVESLRGKILEKYAITTPTTTPGTQVSTASEKVLAEAEDDYGTSYYFRGAVENNYVKFAGLTWRVVRINGDGSVRLILNKNYTKAWYNAAYNANKYVGYSYDATSDDANAKVTKNSTNSTIKAVVDKFYEDNLRGHEQVIADSIFCNDRSLYSGTGKGTTSTQYGAQGRRIKQTTSLKCEQKNDRYTVSDTTKGNGALKYPIGLITYDELINAGAYHRIGNQSYYLYIGDIFFTMSPGEFTPVASNNGGVTISYSDASWSQNEGNVIHGERGVRPVINLKADVQVTGLGTSTSPYEVVNTGSLNTKEGDYKVSQTFKVVPNEGYVYGSTTCTNGASVSYNKETKTLTVSNQTTDTKCTVKFEKLQKLKDAIIANNTLQIETPDFSKGYPNDTDKDSSKSGLYQTRDNEGDTYYFRGDKNLLNNNIEFAEKKWKIVRINGDGTIRLILVDNFTSSSQPLSIGRYAFNEYIYDGNAQHNMVGFTTNNEIHNCTKSTPCEVTYNNGTFSNSNFEGENSKIKTELENWYKKELNNVNDKIASGYFCNDTSSPNFEYNPSSTSTVYYGARDRVETNKKPSLECPDPKDKKGTIRPYGGIYKTKIGLITADEMNMAGFSSYNGLNATSNNYLYIKSDWWSLSPCGSLAYATIFEGNNGRIEGTVTNSTQAVMPVINLNSNVTATGEGTSTNPFIIE